MDLRERSPSAIRRHPWEVVRARTYRRLIAAHCDVQTVRTVLDIGAGDGWFAADIRADLGSGASVVCWDVNYRSNDLETPLGAGISRTSDPPHGSFDVVLALDVLEHVERDEEFLVDVVAPAIGPGGIALLSVPAHPRLFSAHDRMLEHHRRYRPSDFRQLVARHLDVRAHGSLFTSLVLPRAATVLRQRGRAGTSRQTGIGSWTAGPAVTQLATTILAADASVGLWTARLGLALPGLSTWVVAAPRPT